MRYIRIFLLNFQQVFEERARSFVWFLLSLFSPILMVLFWRGAKMSGSYLSFSIISSYYLLMIVGGSFLMSHAEENVSLIDIQEGRLGSYLLKPFLYFFLKWFEEVPNRLLQGGFGVLTLILVVLILHVHINIIFSGFINSVLILLIIFGAVLLAQLYKMNLAFITFWVTDAGGFFQLSEMLLFIFAGYIVPLSLYPTQVAAIAYILPFSYMIYFPVAAVEGIFSVVQLCSILLAQVLWVGIFVLFYKFLWNKGINQFTGVGQ